MMGITEALNKAVEDNQELEKENKELRQRIDKAIEYLNNIEKCCNDVGYIPALYDFNKLFSILKGEDKE